VRSSKECVSVEIEIFQQERERERERERYSLFRQEEQRERVSFRTYFTFAHIYSEDSPFHLASLLGFFFFSSSSNQIK